MVCDSRWVHNADIGFDGRSLLSDCRGVRYLAEHRRYFFSGGVSLWLVVVETIVFWGAFIFGAVFVYRRLRHEFFTYTHYPIRFNRKTRMVHVFRHNGPGGVLSIPWGEVFFHVGSGAQERFVTDLRGHLMDGDRVVETFAVGHFSDSDTTVRKLWKFIVTYMEAGPEALPEGRFIAFTPRASWFNCMLVSYYSCRLTFPSIPLVKWIPILLCTALRRLIMASCKEPVWSQEIEEVSVIESGDPHHLPEPQVIGDFEKTIKDKSAK